MLQLLTVLLLIGVAVVAFKLAIILLVVAGLIFRTKETVGLLAILAVIAGFSAHPLLGIALIAVLVSVSLYFKRKEKAAQLKPDDQQLSLPLPDD